MIRAKIQREAQCGSGGGGGFGTEKHPTGGKTEPRIEPAMAVLVRAAADGVIGRELCAAEAVAQCHKSRQGNGWQYHGPGDARANAEADEHARANDRAQAEHYGTG